MLRTFRAARACGALARPLAWTFVLGCRGTTDPVERTLPAGATRYTPPAVYARWWAQVEACSGLAGPLGSYAWYAVPGERVPYPTGEAVAYTDPEARRVVIAAVYRERGGTVRHEMLHALLGPAYADPARWHPPAYFQARCEGWVDCPAVGCQDAGSPPAPAPPEAPVVPASALRFSVEVTPPAPSRAGADPWFQVVVRATHTGAAPVWVDLGPNLGTAGVPLYAGTGYEIARAAEDGPLEGQFGTTARGRVPFAAGQTRRAVYDVNAAEYPAGEYVARGFYATGRASAPFRVAP